MSPLPLSFPSPPSTAACHPIPVPCICTHTQLPCVPEEKWLFFHPKVTFRLLPGPCPSYVCGASLQHSGPSRPPFLPPLSSQVLSPAPQADVPGPILSTLSLVSLLLVSKFHKKAGTVLIPTLPFAPQHPASESSSNHAVWTALTLSTRVLAAEATGAPASACLTSLGSWSLQSGSPLLASGQRLQILCLGSLLWRRIHLRLFLRLWGGQRSLLPALCSTYSTFEHSMVSTIQIHDFLISLSKLNTIQPLDGALTVPLTLANSDIHRHKKPS